MAYSAMQVANALIDKAKKQKNCRSNANETAKADVFRSIVVL